MTFKGEEAISKAIAYLKLIAGLIPSGDASGINTSAFVLSLLLAKVYRDLLTIQLLCQNSLSVQAGTIAASLWETTMIMGYIRDDNVRANEWIGHEQKIKAYPWNFGNKKLSESVSTELQLNQYDISTYHQIYESLCQIKHINPRVIKYLGHEESQPGTLKIIFGGSSNYHDVYTLNFVAIHANYFAALAGHIYTVFHLQSSSDFLAAREEARVEMIKLNDWLKVQPK